MPRSNRSYNASPSCVLTAKPVMDDVLVRRTSQEALSIRDPSIAVFNSRVQCLQFPRPALGVMYVESAFASYVRNKR